MMKNINKDILPLLISIFLLIFSLGLKLLANYTLNYKHYIGMLLIGISSVLYFKNKKLFAYIFVLTMILGILNIIDICFLSVLFTIGLLEFNPIFLSLLIAFIILNKEMLNKLFPIKEISKQDLIEKERDIRSFERKFQSKTELQLKNIANEKSGYVDEAKIASINILRSRGEKL